VKLVLHGLGWLLLIVTIGLASCQTLLKAAPDPAVPASADPAAAADGRR
jgi:hypothetical protein